MTVVDEPAGRPNVVGVAGAAAVGAVLTGDVIVTAVADEEHASEGVQTVLRRFRCGRLRRHGADQPGRLRRTQGLRLGRASRRGARCPWLAAELGVDAIAGMCPALAGIRALQARLDAAPHPLLGPASLHTSLIGGGNELSSYPVRCMLGLERRPLPGEEIAAVRAELERGALRRGADADRAAAVRVT